MPAQDTAGAIQQTVADLRLLAGGGASAWPADRRNCLDQLHKARVDRAEAVPAQGGQA